MDLQNYKSNALIPAKNNRFYKHHIFLKSLLVFLVSLSLVDAAECSTIDTAMIFYQYTEAGYRKVDSRELSDFFRMITSPDQGDSTYNVTDFYKDGHLKQIGSKFANLSFFGKFCGGILRSKIECPKSKIEFPTL